jgi:hypothetical protein
MSRHYRRFDDESASGRGSRVGLGIGAVLLGTAMGVGIGMLAAPEAGTRTRRRLRRRLAEFGSELGEGLGGVQEFGGRARESMRSRLAQLRAREAMLEDLDEDEDEEDDEGSAFGTFLALAAGVAATYFVSSERAAPARARARDAAVDIRRRAGDRWERFQQERGANGQPGNPHESQSETMENTEPSGESPRGS